MFVESTLRKESPRYLMAKLTQSGVRSISRLAFPTQVQVGIRCNKKTKKTGVNTKSVSSEGGLWSWDYKGDQV